MNAKPKNIKEVNDNFERLETDIRISGLLTKIVECKIGIGMSLDDAYLDTLQWRVNDLKRLADEILNKEN